MQIRKDPLVIGEYYHIFSRSIAKYIVFGDDPDFNRMYQLLRLYRHANFAYKYSAFCDLTLQTQMEVLGQLDDESDCLVEIIAYCLMPSHFHLLLRQSSENGISKFMSRTLNGYSRYFNTRHRRNGPLWSGRFKSVLVGNNQQLLHLTRYIHLNPSSAGLIIDPAEWDYSSFREYIGEENPTSILSAHQTIIDLENEEYKKFVLDQKSYQQDLSLIKSLIIDDYAG